MAGSIPTRGAVMSNHASRSSFSYEDVVLLFGQTGVGLAVVWLVIGAPGVPAAEEFTATQIAPHLQLALFVCVGAVAAYVVGALRVRGRGRRLRRRRGGHPSRGRGSMALAGPHLVRAAIGEDVTQEE